MIDTDPVYEQIKYAKADRAARAYLDAHTHFFTYGENLGTAGLPDAAVRRAVAPDPAAGRSRSVARAASERAALLHDDRDLGEQGQEHRVRGLELSLVEARQLSRDFSTCRGTGRTACFRMAMLPPDEGVRATVEAAGWGLVDPRPISADMDAYRDFIAGSRGEFTVAKDIYVRPNSGWFSDRSVCYLAAGRPVVTMRTGFGKFCPVGRGLFEYAKHEEALAGDRRDCRRLSPATAARRANWPAEYFAADRVLGAAIGGCRAVN